MPSGTILSLLARRAMHINQPLRCCIQGIVFVTLGAVARKDEATGEMQTMCNHNIGTRVVDIDDRGEPPSKEAATLKKDVTLIIMREAFAAWHWLAMVGHGRPWL